MTPRDFVYWLQGYYEILDPKNQSVQILPLSATQSQCIREHLQLVFQHMQPPAPVMTPLVGTGISYQRQPDQWFPTGPFATVC